ncbi:MAG: thioesterase [Chloroflexia bacterium]|nr:thioesterase [Chloroflexia bacterium]
MQLFVSSFEAPHLYNREVKLHKLPNEEFINKISQLGGTPKAAMEDKELLKLIIPILKSDLELCETYKFANDDKLMCPIVGFTGHVDLIVNIENFKAWEERTSAGFRHFMFNGGHFYFQDNLINFMFKFTQLLNELILQNSGNLLIGN